MTPSPFYPARSAEFNHPSDPFEQWLIALLALAGGGEAIATGDQNAIIRWIVLIELFRLLVATVTGSRP